MRTLCKVLRGAQPCENLTKKGYVAEARFCGAVSDWLMACDSRGLTGTARRYHVDCIHLVVYAQKTCV